MKIRFRLARMLGTAALITTLGACGGNSSVANVSLGGTVEGLTSGSVVLINGLTTLTLEANATTFTFPQRINVNTLYNVMIQSHPVNLSCGVLNGLGYTKSEDITNVQVKCIGNNTLGGTVTGLTGGTVVLANGGDVVSVTAPNTTFVFTQRVAKGAPYGVTVLTQPQNGQTCTVFNGTGHMDSTDVTSVQVNCQ